MRVFAKEETYKMQLELTEWEVGTIIKLLEYHKKHDRQNIIDECDVVGFKLSRKTLRLLDEIELQFRDLIRKFCRVKKG